jgi:uncharacterized LabA/DUF88 family protein
MTFKKTVLFIDGANLHHTAKALGFEIDFKRLLGEFNKDGSLLRAYYYTTILDEGDALVRPLLDWLDYNGFTVVSKPAKGFDDGEGRRKIKRSMSVELTVDALELAGFIDQAILFSGDGDYRRPVEALQRRGINVVVVSSLRTPHPMIADELRRQADRFIELDELRSVISRASDSVRTPFARKPLIARVNEFVPAK